MFERSDETLVKQALKGKKSAWVALVKRYEKNLYNYTLRMVSNPADAMDLMQDVFVAVFRNLSTFEAIALLKVGCLKLLTIDVLNFIVVRGQHNRLMITLNSLMKLAMSVQSTLPFQANKQMLCIKHYKRYR